MPCRRRQSRILRLADAQFRRVVRGNLLHRRERVLPRQLDLPHVADVEQTGLRAHREVLVDDARVLHRHVPAAERHHARAVSAMPGVQRRFLELFGGGLVH